MSKRLPFVFVTLAFLACGGGGDGADPGGNDAAGDEAVVDVTPDAAAEEATGDVAGDEAAGDPAEVGPDATPDVSPDGLPACKQGQPCDDGDPCTSGEACDASGACVGGEAHPCDDKRACTDDACDGKGGCTFTLKADACLIDGVCRVKDDVDPEDLCRVCDPAKPTAWSAAADEKPCDPAAVLGPCDDAPAGACDAGTCKPTFVVAKACDDANPCTTDSCDAAAGCGHVKLDDGAACSLASACEPGTCNQGKCVVPAGASCDDGNPCTADTCDAANGCQHAPLDDVPCDSGDACVIESVCEAGQCKGLALNCDDGNLCTEDGCHPVTGCWHDLAINTCCEGGVSKCDDGNVCTTDDCEPVTFACKNTPNTAACNDGDPCTVNDSCGQGTCKGTPKACSDGNPCTVDSCSGGKCVHVTAENGTVCDDGQECSTGDHCEAGQCVADESQCLCDPTFHPSASKIVALSIADTGYPGDGLDLDGDPTTCQPETNGCSDGIDNALGPLAGIPLANDAIKKSIDEGNLILVFEHRNLKTDGTAYGLAFYTAKLAGSNPTCDVQAATCDYVADHNVFDHDCNPLVLLDNAKISGSKLTAGGKSYTFPFDLPLAGIALHLDLYFARVEATVTISGDKVTSMSGILAGAAPKEQIKSAVQALPDDQIPAPFTKQQILDLLDGLVVPDIDGDGDGVKESASLGIKFNAIGGRVVGIY